MVWTDKMVDDLKVMWKQGLTTAEIAKRLGVSKNSVVGKVHRLELDARPSPIKTKSKDEEIQKPEKPAKPAKKACKKSVEAAPKVVAEEPKIEPEPQPKKEESVKVEDKVLAPKPAVVTKSYDGNAKLTDLDNHTCRWPLGDPKDENFHFCGRKVRTGQTYCEEHAALAYVKPNPKK